MMQYEVVEWGLEFLWMIARIVGVLCTIVVLLALCVGGASPPPGATIYPTGAPLCRPTEAEVRRYKPTGELFETACVDWQK